MAKEKFLTSEEFQNKFETGEELKFNIQSPFAAISISLEKTLFFAWHWDKPVVMAGTTGTAYACRIGDPPYKSDFVVYSFRLDENDVPVVFHVYTNYHHTNEIPKFISYQMPDYIKNKIKDK